VEKAVTRHGFSRYVLADSEGYLTGYVHLKDVLDLEVASASAAAPDSYSGQIPAKRIRALISIFEDTDLEDALATMRRSGAHLARSFTAEGETTGVLFLEDIIEELVGEVQDATRRE
jgi:CBS domain containing-hemolysin-like protein